MADKKVIAVVGAMGAQGGGLVRSIAADRDGPFVARAITRKPDSDKAKAMAALGVEVVAGDADDPPSLERAFAGAHGVFCVTNFWEHFSTEREGAQATAMARATRKAGVAHSHAYLLARQREEATRRLQKAAPMPRRVKDPLSRKGISMARTWA